jgi:DMSO/TMAO reductase YedYZ heme-binding membrane subunit
VATTRSRPPRGREQARHASGGPTAEHAGKIYGLAIAGIVVIVAVLAFTSIGHVIDAATQHFMLFYAGVFALIGLCASVGIGLVATDRMILHPGQRVFIQSAHRAVSFGALAFLIVHIVTEILAQRVHILDAVVPFLSPFRTFYIGLGTIASDLIILLVITGIYRKRFTTSGKAWRWRAIHYSSYVAFVFGVWHGLLGGRPGKPYVDWSYGFVVAFVMLGLAVRVFANSLRPKESLSCAPVGDAASSGSAPMRAAAMFAQLGAARAAASQAPVIMPATGTAPRRALPASGSPGGRSGPVHAIAALAAPVYEAGYEGPPRYAGAPRNPSSGPMPRYATGPLPRAAGGRSGQYPAVGNPSGPYPAMGGPSGPYPAVGGPSGPYPAMGGPAGPGRVPGARPQTGPMPRAQSGPMPRAQSGPMPRAQSGPMPRAGTGPMPRAQTGPMPRAATGPMPRPQPGPMPRSGIGAFPAEGSRSAVPPWENGMPAGDPGLRYREPGPGMPGYRGAAGQRDGYDAYYGDNGGYGHYGDGQYPDGQYADQHQYPTGQYPSGQYPVDPRWDGRQ